MSNTGVVAIFVVLTLLLIVVVIAYLVWRMNSSRMGSVKAMEGPTRMHNKPPTVIKASLLQAMSVGQAYSVSFWMYLTDYKPTEYGKLVLWRQNQSDADSSTPTVKGTNPVVFLDPNANIMYVCIATNRKPKEASNQLVDLLRTSGTGDSNNWSYLVAKVDYVPLQRWVNYTFTVQENLLSLYQDGSLYTVATLYDMVDMTQCSACTSGSCPCVPRPVFAAVTGNMVVGNVTGNKTPESGSMRSSDVTGFVARVHFFNYGLTSRQAHSLYYNGPTKFGFLRMLGVPDYGVRSPLYRLDANGDEDSNNSGDWNNDDDKK